MDIFNEQSLILIQDVDKAIQKKADGNINVCPILTQSALDIICGRFIWIICYQFSTLMPFNR